MLLDRGLAGVTQQTLEINVSVFKHFCFSPNATSLFTPFKTHKHTHTRTHTQHWKEVLLHECVCVFVSMFEYVCFYMRLLVCVCACVCL